MANKEKKEETKTEKKIERKTQKYTGPRKYRGEGKKRGRIT